MMMMKMMTRGHCSSMPRCIEQGLQPNVITYSSGLLQVIHHQHWITVIDKFALDTFHAIMRTTRCHKLFKDRVSVN